MRVRHQLGKWEPIPNALIEDPELSPLARYLGIWLASRPKGWEIRAQILPHLIKDPRRQSGHIGRDVTRRLIKELEAAGYLIRSRHHDPNGNWFWDSCFDARKVTAPAMPWETVGGNSGDIDHTDLVQSEVNQKTTTASDVARLDHRNSVVVATKSLKIPEILAGVQHQYAVRMIERCPKEQQQAVLDEIGALAHAGRVRRPLALLFRLVSRAQLGEFAPSAAVERTRALASMQSASPSPSVISRPENESRQLAETMLKKLRAKFRLPPGR